MTQSMTRHLTTTISNNYITNCVPPVQAIPGDVFFDSGTQVLRVWDGSTWLEILSSVNVSLDEESADAIDWAIRRIKDESRISELADKYPMVADALKELEVVLKLHQNIQNDETNK